MNSLFCWTATTVVGAQQIVVNWESLIMINCESYLHETVIFANTFNTFLVKHFPLSDIGTNTLVRFQIKTNWTGFELKKKNDFFVCFSVFVSFKY